MKKGAFCYSLAITMILGLFSCVSAVQAEEKSQGYPDRWVYVSRNLTKDEDVDQIREITETSRKHGLNGMLLASSWDYLHQWKEDRLKRLEKIKASCAENKIDIIPILWSVGYGSGLGIDKNLAEGLPCKNIPFIVEGKEARLAPDSDVKFINGGFEEFQNNRMKGYAFHDRPGQVSFVDTNIFKSGRTSLRFENYGDHPHGHARVMQEFSIKPNRQYRVSCWVRTENIEPVTAFMIQVYGPKENIAPFHPKIKSTTDWQEMSLVFMSQQYDKVKVYAGLWGGKSGRLWLDDFKIEEIALVNVLRRHGTPLTVTSEDGKVTYTEGQDYEPVIDSKFNLRHPRKDNPSIRLTGNSRMKNGQRVLVSCYHGMAINDGQVTVCMSEPKLYDFWRESAIAVKKHLNSDKWFLSMDEIRAGGSCAACKARNQSMGEILGDCITKQIKIIREVKPAAKVYIWSDMLDPNHNAHGNYYLVDGDFTNSWNHVPKDLIICCWYFKMREPSMQFFSGLGFETLAGAYYDGDTMDNINGWIKTVNETPKCQGIMYTTWQNKYKLLPDFGDAVVKESRPK
ncbi:MAG: hypothetical protein PHI84_10190 [Kiritimatiellae bacterium]|nr:hypothetical protein [Kiritimatiellia bacterium]